MAEEKAPEKAPEKPKPASARPAAKRSKKVVEAEGVAHITATFNNTLIVMSVLLNVAVMCATPSASTTFLERLAAGRADAGFGFSGAFSGAFSSAMCLYFFRTGFFLPAIARRGPFFVRALVWVRWPRTGRFLR